MKLQALGGIAALILAAAAHAQSPPTLASRWTIDRTLVASSAPLRLGLTLVTLDDTGWTDRRMAAAAIAGARLLAPCGIALDRVEVLTYVGGPREWRDLWTPASRELARLAAPARPAVFFVAGTRHRPAFEAEAFGRPNTSTRPELVHTVWVTAAARDLPIVIAHELVHVLSGSGEHSDRPRNLMREDTAPDHTLLTAAQCAGIRAHALGEGLVAAPAGAAQAGAGAVEARGTTTR